MPVTCLRNAGFAGTIYLILGMLSAVAEGQSGPPADGPASLKALSLEELSKIEVTSVSKEATAAFKTAAAIFVLTESDIHRSGATNIPDLLRLVPGVEVSQIDSGKWAVGIRGFEGRLSKSVLVLIDGRSVYTPLFAGVYWEMQDTMIEDIDHIEVIRGPGGTIWGSNAVNGVINIITKNAKDTRGSLASTGGGNVEQGFLRARYGAGNDQLSYRVYGMGFTRGPQFHGDERNFDDWRSGQAGFRLDWTPNRSDTLNLTGNVYQRDVGSKLNISSFSPPSIVGLEANGDFSGQNLTGGWRRTLRSGSDVQVRAYYDRTDRKDLNYRETRSTIDIDFIHHLAMGRHDVIWGAGLRVSPSRYTQTVPTVDFLPHRQTYSIYSGFVQDAIRLVGNRLTATLGSKVEYNTFSGFEFQPSGRLAWTPTERQTVWGAVTRAVRTPSRIEETFQFNALLQANPPLYVRLIGDGEFTPEQMVGYELGFRSYVKKAGILSIGAFYNRYDDLLSVDSAPLVVETSPAPVHLVIPLFLRNGIQAQTKGVEIASVWDLRGWWRMKGSYSFMELDAQRNASSNDASTIGQLEGDSPQHKVVIQSFFTLGRGLNLDLTYRYVSSLPGSDQKVAGYSTGDVRFSKRLGREFEVSVVGQNLLQPEHAEYAGDPGGLVGIKRSAYLKLTWSR